jgi:hypothetical protein
MKKIMMLLSLSFVMCVSCSSVSTLSTPEGFAHFDKERNYRAASADAVSISSYVIESKAMQEDNPLATWVKEADRVLVSKGYIALSTNQITLRTGLAGTYSEYEVMYNAEPWIYSLLVVKDDGRIVVAEVSGEKSVYLKRKERILESLKTIVVK